MIDLIAAMRPKQHYYVVKPEGRRIVDFLLGPTALTLLGSTSVEQAAAAEAAASTNPDFWTEDVRRRWDG